MSFWFLTLSNEIGALEEKWSSIILLTPPEGGKTELAVERRPVVSSLHFHSFKVATELHPSFLLYYAILMLEIVVVHRGHRNRRFIEQCLS